jgi:hypothetical protein
MIRAIMTLLFTKSLRSAASQEKKYPGAEEANCGQSADCAAYNGTD